MQAKTVLLDSATLGSGVSLAKLSGLTRLKTYRATTPQQVVARIRHAEIIITNKVVLTASMLAQCKQLRHICLLATGSNNIDTPYCKTHGITVLPVSSYSTAEVAHHTLALMLCLHQQLLAYRSQIAKGAWQDSKTFWLHTPSLASLTGKQVGIVGYGNIGKAFARLVRALGMEVVVAKRNPSDRRAGRKTIDYLFKHMDVISLHCPLTPATALLASARRIASMKKGALLLNCSRGGLVDEAALLRRLKTNTIAAGLDVISQEPPPKNCALIKNARPNLIITPHVAWSPLATRQKLVDYMTANVARCLKNK